MNTSNLKSTLAAAAVALSLLAPVAQAQGQDPDADIGALIAAQGNAALRQIREELESTVRAAARPTLPARPRFSAQTTELKLRPKNTKAGA